VDIALAEAIAPALRDLATSEFVIAEVRDGQWGNSDGLATGMLFGPDGSGQGVSVMIGEPLPERIVVATDQVQDWAVEELWSIGRPTNWPRCPEHPQSHPLSAMARDDLAVWACPKTGHVVSEIGQLPAPGS
jgi:hypothetical protein